MKREGGVCARVLKECLPRGAHATGHAPMPKHFHAKTERVKCNVFRAHRRRATKLKEFQAQYPSTTRQQEAPLRLPPVVLRPAQPRVAKVVEIDGRVARLDEGPHAPVGVRRQREDARLRHRAVQHHLLTLLLLLLLVALLLPLLALLR